MMPGSHKKRLRRLIRRYREGKTSAEESAFAARYYDYFDSRQDFTDRLNEEEKIALGQKIYEKIARQVALADTPPVLHPYRIYRKLAAAAAILIILAGSIYWFGRRTRPEPAAYSEPPALPAHDVAAGSTRATLILANGRKIALDSAGSGLLASEGSTNIQKQGGQLVYQPSGKPAPDLFNQLTTGRGQQYQLVLPDGSRVWLNAASSLRFPAAFSGKQRIVELTGEAYFEVSHEAGRPFHVKTGAMDVEVLGTHFNINAYQDEPAIRTTLLEGSVKVSAGRSRKILVPGQQAIAGNTMLNVTGKVNTNQVVAWKNGQLYFADMDLRSILRQVARWYDVEIIYETSSNENYTVLVGRDVPLSKLLHSIEAIGGVHFTLGNKQVTVKP